MEQTDNTISGNKLIAEFMGEKIAQVNVKGTVSYHLSKHFLAELSYHLSWDWLMPVAKKCIDSYHDMRQDIFLALNKVDIKELWLAVVEFIKWYKENGRKV